MAHTVPAVRSRASLAPPVYNVQNVDDDVIECKLSPLTNLVVSRSQELERTDNVVLHKLDAHLCRAVLEASSRRDTLQDSFVVYYETGVKVAESFPPAKLPLDTLPNVQFAEFSENDVQRYEQFFYQHVPAKTKALVYGAYMVIKVSRNRRKSNSRAEVKAPLPTNIPIDASALINMARLYSLNESVIEIKGGDPTLNNKIALQASEGLPLDLILEWLNSAAAFSTPVRREYHYSWMETPGFEAVKRNLSYFFHSRLGAEMERVQEFYENQRWYLNGWGAPGAWDRWACSDESGKLQRDVAWFEKHREHGWITVGKWSVYLDGFRDADGWEYAMNFQNFNWSKRRAFFCFVRRRKWVRKMLRVLSS